jgi:hypothetical protein
LTFSKYAFNLAACTPTSSYQALELRQMSLASAADLKPLESYMDENRA